MGLSLSNLSKIIKRKSKRLGQGHGSGKVKTAGRGTKGQKARDNISLRFAGSSLQASWLKRLPLLRGKGKNKTLNTKPIILNVRDLNKFKEGAEVSEKILKMKNVKILSDGDLKIKLTVKVPCSASARAKIEKAGGKVL